MKNIPCPPLADVLRIGKRYPGVWGNIDLLVTAARAGELPPWDFDLCYCPIAAAIAAVQPSAAPTHDEIGMAGYVAALASWRRHKMIYRFDASLATELVSTADDTTLPIDVLYAMPTQCVYIQYPDTPGAEVDGFFAHIEHDPTRGDRELRLNFLRKNGEFLTSYIVHIIPGGTIGDGIDKAVKVIRQNLKTAQLPGAESVAQYLDEARQNTIEAVQLVLYVCAENADIEENAEQSKIYRPSDRVLDKYRELRKWDVGVKTGIILRAAERKRPDEPDAPEDGAEPGETKKFNRTHKSRPHVRRAHWHHFWTGPAENKKIILRWLSPMIINADDGDTPVVIVRKDKK